MHRDTNLRNGKQAIAASRTVKCCPEDVLAFAPERCQSQYGGEGGTSSPGGRAQAHIHTGPTTAGLISLN